MKRTHRGPKAIGWGFACLVLACFGCNSIGRYNIKIVSGVGDRTVEVHLVGVNATDFAKWNEYKMTTYWRHDDPMNSGSVAIREQVKFGQNLDVSQLLEKNRPIWKTWKKQQCWHLFILANLPGYFAKDDRDGDADPRRLVLPLGTKRWSFPHKWKTPIEIRVEPGGIRCLTPPKPEKK